MFNSRDFLYGAVKVQIIGTNASKINIQGTDIKDKNILVQYFQRSVNFKSKLSCSFLNQKTNQNYFLISASKMSPIKKVNALHNKHQLGVFNTI